MRPCPEPSTTAGHRHTQEVGAAVASPRLLTSTLSLEAKLQVSDLIAAPGQVSLSLSFNARLGSLYLLVPHECECVYVWVCLSVCLCLCVCLTCMSLSFFVSMRVKAGGWGVCVFQKAKPHCIRKEHKPRSGGRSL